MSRVVKIIASETTSQGEEKTPLAACGRVVDQYSGLLWKKGVSYPHARLLVVGLCRKLAAFPQAGVWLYGSLCSATRTTFSLLFRLYAHSTQGLLLKLLII